jgi:hypothetical protein
MSAETVTGTVVEYVSVCGIVRCSPVVSAGFPSAVCRAATALALLVPYTDCVIEVQVLPACTL